MLLKSLSAVSVVLLMSAVAAAQDVPPDTVLDPSSAARFHLGALRFSPTFGVTDAGVDTNVFNDADHPKQDYTATFTPRTEFWLNLGSARLSGKASVSYLYFRTYARERAVNTDDSMTLDLPHARVRPYASVSYLNAQDRQGYEIDARVRHGQQAVTVGIDVPIGGALTVGLSAGRNRLRYANDAVYQDVSLAETLDRDADSLTASLGYQATTLTKLIVQADVGRERFRAVAGRNSRSLKMSAGVEFSPLAFLVGSARVGFRKFDILDPRVEDYAGLVAAADLTCVISDSTRLAVQIQRDVNYSFLIEEPYYVLSGITVSVTQRVYGPVDVQGRVGREQLAYRSTAGVGALAAAHNDHAATFGGGVGIRMGETSRMGVNVDAYRRRSPATARDFDALRVGATLTYGF